MRSAIYHGREDIRVEEYPEPETGPNDVKIDVSACGICGSDLHEYAAGPISIPDDEPHPVTGETLPLPMGHEFAGRVTEVGSNVSEIAVGDKVAANPVIWCGECRYCLEGEYGLCESNGFVGLSGWGGGFSEYTTVDRRQAVPIPESVPLEYGPLVEPFSVGLYAIRNSEFSPGDSVAVFGTGPIGLTVVQLANAAGAGPIYAVEPRDFRREIAAESGADVTLDPTAESALDVINADTNGGVDVAFEVAGASRLSTIRSPQRERAAR
ncbi:alcohol dehydrogenase catalytic domain-containing protein [Halorubrum sp. CBA1125]|uniref:alcohol dehydrogenase catalytic domain-containing protein n=1 Tax=Halorubrum sp. CBA1125 TaxID=2668072 RepID=UPI0018D20654|nr:alcohol dehydrogenase catalytic domain-containing protein [Halorubrum sp. CBA1125]